MTVQEPAEYGMERVDRAAVETCLADASVGVLGLADEGIPYLLPLSYAFDGDDRLYFTYLLGESSRKETLTEDAGQGRFLVYDAETLFRWRSVTVTGALSRIPEDQWSTLGDVLAEAWRPNLLETASTGGVAVYELVIEEWSGIRQDGLAPEFRENIELVSLGWPQLIVGGCRRAVRVPGWSDTDGRVFVLGYLRDGVERVTGERVRQRLCVMERTEDHPLDDIGRHVGDSGDPSSVVRDGDAVAVHNPPLVGVVGMDLEDVLTTHRGQPLGPTGEHPAVELLEDAPGREHQLVVGQFVARRHRVDRDQRCGLLPVRVRVGVEDTGSLVDTVGERPPLELLADRFVIHSRIDR